MANHFGALRPKMPIGALRAIFGRKTLGPATFGAFRKKMLLAVIRATFGRKQLHSVLFRRISAAYFHLSYFRRQTLRIPIWAHSSRKCSSEPFEHFLVVKLLSQPLLALSRSKCFTLSRESLSVAKLCGEPFWRTPAENAPRSGSSIFRS